MADAPAPTPKQRAAGLSIWKGAVEPTPVSGGTTNVNLLVVDNTNPARSDRLAYIAPARQASYRVIGFYFQSHVADCERRNRQRDRSGINRRDDITRLPQ